MLTESASVPCPASHSHIIREARGNEPGCTGCLPTGACYRWVSKVCTGSAVRAKHRSLFTSSRPIDAMEHNREKMNTSDIHANSTHTQATRTRDQLTQGYVPPSPHPPPPAAALNSLLDRTPPEPSSHRYAKSLARSCLSLLPRSSADRQNCTSRGCSRPTVYKCLSLRQVKGHHDWGRHGTHGLRLHCNIPHPHLHQLTCSPETPHGCRRAQT